MSAEIFRPVDIYLAIQKPESLYWQFAISTFQEWRQMLMSGKEIKVEFNDFKKNRMIQLKWCTIPKFGSI